VDDHDDPDDRRQRYRSWDEDDPPRRRRRRYEEEDEDASRFRKPLGHSTLGILSFGLSLLTGAGIFLLFVIAGVLTAASGGPPPDDSPQAIIIGLGFIGGLGIALVGLVLGVVGMLSPNHNRTFAYLGVGFNGVILLGTIALLCVGMMMG
jgi:hypothetical protein